MSDEQHRVALFQSQPEGLGLFSRPPALEMTYVDDYIASFLPCWTGK